MKKGVGLGIIVLLVVLLASPVLACHTEVTITGDKEVCTTCDVFTYTINVQSVASRYGDTNKLVIVEDTLPAGIKYVSFTEIGAPGTVTAVCLDPPSSTLDAQCKKIQWSYVNVPHYAQWSILLSVTNNGVTDGNSVTNTIISKWKYQNNNVYGPWTGHGTLGSGTASFATKFLNSICPIPTPEFPTMALPAALIVGLISAVLFIQRSKEN